MSDNKKSDTYYGGIGTTGALGVLFVALKLTNHIDWPWVWVLCPFWFWFALIGAAFLIVGLFALICAVYDSLTRRRRARR